MADALDPAAVTARVGVAPDVAHRKGEVVRRTAAGREALSRSGLWSVGTDTADETPPDRQVAALHARLHLDSEATATALRAIDGRRDLFVHWVGPRRPTAADLPDSLRRMAETLDAAIDVDWSPDA